MSFFRKKGISLLVPTQNTESTVELCLKSFVDFCDEMIVVDNGSTDNTISIVKNIAEKYNHIKFFDAPHLKDLYENRQYALERSKYNWIVRIDSDYIAHNDGPNNILNLRKKILESKRGIRFKAFGITQVNLNYDFFHVGIPKAMLKKTHKSHVMPPISTLPYRIIKWYPGLKFKKIGRWEGVSFQSTKFYNHKVLKTPYWFHCNFKTKKEYFIRHYRNDWRELGNFKKYPERTKYIIEKAIEIYGTDDLEVAGEKHFNENIKPFLVKINNFSKIEYPKLIKHKLSEICNKKNHQ